MVSISVSEIPVLENIFREKKTLDDAQHNMPTS